MKSIFLIRLADLFSTASPHLPSVLHRTAWSFPPSLPASHTRSLCRTSGEALTSSMKSSFSNRGAVWICGSHRTDSHGKCFVERKGKNGGGEAVRHGGKEGEREGGRQARR